jgi:hypothetical protein
MNQAILQQYLAQYKKEFHRIHAEEKYKWEVVKHFQNTWDLDAEDFATMLESALTGTIGLLDSGNYFPRRMVIESAEVAPETVRAAFSKLYEESISLQERVDTFQKRLVQLIHSHWPEKSHYQDHRAILVYLSLHYPDIHYFYKYSVLESFCEKVGYDYKPVSGRFENIEAFYDICATVKKYLMADAELMEMHFDHLTKEDDPDTEFNILTQDFLFAIDRYFGSAEKVVDEFETVLPSRQAQAILNVLVNHIQAGNVLPNDPSTFIGYKQMHDVLGLEMVAHAYGRSLQLQGLNDLAEWTIENDLPAITGLIIDWGTLMPGPGYFKAFGRPEDDFRWWQNEIKKSMEFDWSPYIKKSAIRTEVRRLGDIPEPQAPPDSLADEQDPITHLFESPQASDVEEPKLPERAECTTYRIVRDTKKALWVKNIYQFKCQICGESVELSDRNYSEAHHIKPLGHDGPDDENNIISVCPNHHVMLDYFAIKLDLAQLNVHPSHHLKAEYINYHNSQFDKGKKN